MIRYSLLTSDKKILADKKCVQELLCQGIKVIAFGASSDLDKLAVGLEKYKDCRLLQLYPIKQNIPVVSVNDGALDKETSNILSSLSELVPSFNYEQYIIEH